MLAGYKIQLAELFYGYEKYWQEVTFKEFVKQVTDKRVEDMITYSDKEYLALLNSAYLQGPFAMSKILMPSEMFLFLQQLRQVYEKHFNAKDTGEPDILAEDVFAANLDFDNDSMLKVHYLYGQGYTVLGCQLDEFRNKFKDNLFNFWIGHNADNRKIIMGLVRNRIRVTKERVGCSQS